MDSCRICQKIVMNYLADQSMIFYLIAIYFIYTHINYIIVIMGCLPIILCDTCK